MVDKIVYDTQSSSLARISFPGVYSFKMSTLLLELVVRSYDTTEAIFDIEISNVITITMIKACDCPGHIRDISYIVVFYVKL